MARVVLVECGVRWLWRVAVMLAVCGVVVCLGIVAARTWAGVGGGNGVHVGVVGMRRRYEANAIDPIVDDSATVLFGMAQLAEGSELLDPVKFNEAMVRMTERSLGE